ncbi:MAG: hypothetical protein SFX19_09545 [Alphaproteobacteria bacterium]|nr:hypothetical protein [Alphaproteobacteria bacterium]
MRRLPDTLKVKLPEPSVITTARRNIDSTEFRHHLESEYGLEDPNDVNRFIVFLDKCLQDFGKGMAYVHWRYGRVAPAISIGEPSGAFYAFSEHHRSDAFPDVSIVRNKIGKGGSAKSVKFDLCTLTDHRDTNGHGLGLPFWDLYAFYTRRHKDGHSGFTKSVCGQEGQMDLTSLLIAVGAHETFHLYDRLTNNNHKVEYASYAAPPNMPEDDARKHYLNHPIERRAQQAACEALAYYQNINSPSRT